MTIHIEWQEQFGRWYHYQTMHNQADAYRVAQRRAESTKKRHRLLDENGNLFDILNQEDRSTTDDRTTAREA